MKRFLRDFNMTPRGTQIIIQRSSVSCVNGHNFRPLLPNLWLKLLALMMDLISGARAASSGLSHTTISIILSIHSIIDLIPEQDGSRPVDDNTIDMAIYCLVLIGLVMSEVQHHYYWGFLYLRCT